MGNADLILQVSSPGVTDADPADNMCAVHCSICFAQNAERPYRWVEDAYQFDNWSYTGLELQGLCVSSQAPLRAFCRCDTPGCWPYRRALPGV